MPELPEVEIISGGLKGTLSGKLLTGLKIQNPSSLVINEGRQKKSSFALSYFKDNFLFKKAREISRHGKLIMVSFENDRHLAIHLMMTGQIIVRNSERSREEQPRYTRAIFEFEEKNVFFCDKRKFGYIEVLKNKAELEKKLTGRGIDALSADLTPEYLISIFSSRKIPIKAALLNQRIIAGIGNAYSDEILFEAGINPTRPVAELTEAEITRIIETVRTVLFNGIASGGLTLSDFVNLEGKPGSFQEFLKVYGRSGCDCYLCGSKIVKHKVSGRTANFCPCCQK